MSENKFREIHIDKIDPYIMMARMIKNPRPTGEARLKMLEFINEFLEYSQWFEREKSDPDGSWAWEFVVWLYDKVGWSDEGELGEKK